MRGVDLKNIKAIERIAVQAGNNANVKLQSSMNGVIWTDVNTKALEDARYVDFTMPEMKHRMFLLRNLQ